MKFIAEFCQNHNGDYGLLQEMIHQAAEAGAYYGKMQTIFSDDLTYRPRFEEGEEIKGETITIKRPYLPEYERLKLLELSYEQHARFVQDCNNYGLVPLTTAFSQNRIGFIKEAGFRHIKIASYDCASLSLIEKACDAFDFILLSTGATYDEEIRISCDLMRTKQTPFALLHCVTIYPTPLNEMHLRRMEFLKQFTGATGLSEHSLVERDGIKASLAAIYLGAEYIERHVRLLAPEKSKDGRVSITPDHIKELVNFSRLSKDAQKELLFSAVPEFETLLGTAARSLSKEELRNRDYYRGRFAMHIHRKPIFNWEPMPQ